MFIAVIILILAGTPVVNGDKVVLSGGYHGGEVVDWVTDTVSVSPKNLATMKLADGCKYREVPEPGKRKNVQAVYVGGGEVHE